MNWNIWAIIGSYIGTAIITIIVTLIIVKQQRQRKELSYKIEQRALLAPEEPGTSGVRWDPGIKVSYRGREVSQLFSFKVTFRNTGNQTLEHLPIVLKPNVGAEILNLMIGHAKDVEVGEIDYHLDKPEEWEVQVGFLNEKNEIKAYGIGTSKQKLELAINVRQPGVRVRNRPEYWTSGEALRSALETFWRAYLPPFR